MMKESWWTMADLTELNFCSRQDLFDLTKEMSSCTVQLLKKHFKSKRSSLETSDLNGVALASAHTPSATPGPGRTLYNRTGYPTSKCIKATAGICGYGGHHVPGYASMHTLGSTRARTLCICIAGYLQVADMHIRGCPRRYHYGYPGTRIPISPGYGYPHTNLALKILA